MATIRPGDLPVLVIVDTQVGVLRDCWEADRVVQAVADVTTRARNVGLQVLWVQHDDAQLVHGSDDWQWVPGLGPAEGEALVRKHHECAFEATTLEAELAARGATHLVLAGAASNWCIRATAYGALDRGYDLTLLHDAHTTQSIPLDDGRTVEAFGIVADLNLTMRWISYPGRRATIASARTLDLAALSAPAA